MSANEPAFPITGKYEGLTKREYFAAMAMQGLLSHSDFDYCPLTYESVGKIVNDSFCLAEAMIKASQVQP